MGKQAAIKVDGMTELLRALSQLPKDVQGEVRDASQRIADEVAQQVRGQGTAQAQPLTNGVKAKRDRVPVINFGGNKKSGLSGKAKLGDLMGANFGSNKAKQFPRVARPDFYVYRTIQARGRWLFDQWAEAVARAARKVDPSYRDR